ncbi:hypothetical protein ACMYR3_08830 [Ampullimonas aquatilis]|uniref:hypothetical protein n=1 Tax=Ampullimonas aquatilis TaxID=1341549 RepID=UPI003C73596F
MATRQYKPSSNIPTVRLSNSRPFITQKAVLNSLHAQQIFERGYDMCANGLFSLTVVLRFIGTEEQAQAVETMVDDLLNKALDEIRQEIARMKELSESNGCETMISYTNSRTVEIQITSPRSIRFLAIIREFDQLIAAMDTLWLACIIDDTHYAVEAYQWKRRILRLAGQIRTLATRAILAARKKENAEIAAEEKEATLINELSATPHREPESTPGADLHR